MADDFKVIKVDRFDSKAIRHAFDDVGRQTFNNRVSFLKIYFLSRLRQIPTCLQKAKIKTSLGINDRYNSLGLTILRMRPNYGFHF